MYLLYNFNKQRDVGNLLMSHIIKILFLSALMLGVACQGEPPVAETEFVALDQEKGYWFSSPAFLIKKVHRARWRIAYGFADNNYCGHRFKGRYGEQLLNSVSDILRLWLGALAEQTNIVNRFSYELRKLKYGVSRPSFGYGWFDSKPDLAIIFYCQRGRSFMQTKPFPMLHMLQASDTSNHNRMTALRSYRASTLLHELGHAFGLGDTYVDRTSLSRRLKRFNHSTSGVKTTTGAQPLSVMNHHRVVALNADDSLQLTNDDRDGMQWLYERYVSKETGRNGCPFEYRHESTTKGCAPAYPLIHAVKQRNWTTVYMLLRDDKKIDINTQDKLGNTALHYAAPTSTGSDLYLYLIDKGADASIRNRNGDSAADLRRHSRSGTRPLTAIIAAEMRHGAANYAAWLLDYTLRKHGNRSAKHALKAVKHHLTACDMQEMTLLQYVALGGYSQVLQLMLQQSEVNINQQCASGNTALHLAAGMGHIEVTKLLLAQPYIEVNVKNTTGDTPHSLVLARMSRYRSNATQRKRLEAVEAALNTYLDALPSNK